MNTVTSGSATVVPSCFLACYFLLLASAFTLRRSLRMRLDGTRCEAARFACAMRQDGIVDDILNGKLGNSAARFIAAIFDPLHRTWAVRCCVMVAMFAGHPRDRLNPARALVHPTWWAALLILAANDHALKGSGMLPGLLTGKLSDFAGLFVAPTVCACVVLARRRVSVVACHVVVAVVFALLKLSPTAANMWKEAFAVLGLPWRTWADPIDLVALSIVPVAYAILAPAMQRTPEPRIRRTELASLALGLVFCAATAPNRLPQTKAPDQADDLLADVFVHVPQDETDLGVHVREPANKLDCERLLSAPSEVLDSADFKLPHGGVVFPGENQAIWDVRHREASGGGCSALLIDAAQSTWFGISSKKLPPTFVVWDTSKIPVRPIPTRQHDDGLSDGALIIREAGDGLKLTVRGPVLTVPASSTRR